MYKTIHILQIRYRLRRLRDRLPVDGLVGVVGVGVGVGGRKKKRRKKTTKQRNGSNKEDLPNEKPFVRFVWYV